MNLNRKKILLLGASGSVGQQAISVIEKFPQHFQLVSASIGYNISVIPNLINNLGVKNIYVIKEEDKINLEKQFPKISFFSSKTGIVDFIKKSKYNFAINALSGIFGLRPTLTIIEQKKPLALANKESLVVAGHLIMRALKKSKSQLLTLDSEHSAIWQILQKETFSKINFVILTASGGPFLYKDIADFKNITIKEALNHPTWNMGKKILIDSASMMNKVFEVYEAKWLFNLSLSQIKVMIEPNSFLHGGVQFIDGSLHWELSRPTMILPIEYAMFYPERQANPIKPLKIEDFNKLKFLKLEEKRYPLFFIGTAYLDQELSWPVVLNAANEMAVALFLEGKITFVEITTIIKEHLQEHQPIAFPALSEIETIDKNIRIKIKNKYGG